MLSREALQSRIDALARTAEPAVEPVFLPWPAPPTPVGVLTGSFNPLTRAHAALAQAGRRAGLPGVLLAISVHTIDKAEVTGLSLVNRLVILQRFARRRHALGVVAFSQGLYVQQAQALRRRWPGSQPVFLVGYDKIVQILDPHYYDDREAALRTFFSLAGLLVAPRAGAGPSELRALLERPENRPYAPFITYLPLPPAAARLSALSATQVRARAAAGEDLRGLVPRETIDFLARKQVY